MWFFLLPNESFFGHRLTPGLGGGRRTAATLAAAARVAAAAAPGVDAHGGSGAMALEMGWFYGIHGIKNVWLFDIGWVLRLV